MPRAKEAVDRKEQAGPRLWSRLALAIAAIFVYWLHHSLIDHLV